MSEEYASYEEWVASRPPAIQTLIRQFPTGTLMLVRDVPHHVLGYGENDDGNHDLILSPINPIQDYEGALAAKVYCCAKHFTPRVWEDGQVRVWEYDQVEEWVERGFMSARAGALMQQSRESWGGILLPEKPKPEEGGV